MKTRGMILLIVFVCGVSLAATPAVSTASESMRWGIAPKKSSPSEPETTEMKSETPAPSKPETSVQPLPSKGQAPKDKDSGPTTQDAKKKPANQVSAPPSAETDLPQTPSSEKKTTPTPKPESKAKQIIWASDQQQKTCEAYLVKLRDLFLKTRHYSIQGASCDTAENATAFLQTWEKSKQECPKAFLDKSGYTNRIIRNITYLEKLGIDRCDAVPEPATPSVATQKKQDTGSRK